MYSRAGSLEGAMRMGHPLTLVGFMEMYATQDACQGRSSSSAGGKGSAVRAALTRWPGRVARPRAVRGRGRGYQASLPRARCSTRRAPICASGCWRSDCWPQDHAGYAPRRHAPAPDRRRRRQDPDQGRRRPDLARRRRQERRLQRLPGAARRCLPSTSRTQSPRRRPPASCRPPCTSSPSNFKRWRLDIFRGVSAAHLQSYRDELRYRLWPP